MVNCQSIVNKTHTIQVETASHNIDLCALTETWIKQEDNTTILACCPLNYKAIPMPRPIKTSSGIAIIYKDRLKVSQNNAYEYTTMECTDFIVSTSSNDKNTYLAVIYWPLDTSTIAFLMDLANYMERNINITGNLILFGDFNIHVNNTQSPDTPSILMTFLTVLDSCTKSHFPHTVHWTPQI